MGSLIVKKVIYSGDNFFYESPELKTGINVIVGDNGSGKSTFSYFIEYGLGGKVKSFNDDDDDAKYFLILEDTNNYIQLDILIDNKPYSLKRFINQSDVFVDDYVSIETYPIVRYSRNFIFSDWLLEKLKIPVFEMYLGASHWYFNFSDLFRLLNYDQNTEPRKIYKSPVAENFIADSILIRKSIFEILLGMSSVEYFKHLESLKALSKARDTAKAIYESFKSTAGNLFDVTFLTQKKNSLVKNLHEHESQRNNYLKKNTTVDDKIGELANIQSALTNLEVNSSKNRVKLISLKNEQNNIEELYRKLEEEIQQIKKIIFTHDKLDLFAMEVCPFCLNKKDVEEGFCICGSKFNIDDYEKFVYNSSEYTDILQRKQKSINAILIAKHQYQLDIDILTAELEIDARHIVENTEKLKKIIATAEYAGNNLIIDDLNDKIIKIKEELFKIDSDVKNSLKFQMLKEDFDKKVKNLGIAQVNFNKAKVAFEKNNLDTIESFNKVYSKLLARSSYESKVAYIDDDYMPYIDNLAYKANSTDVPKRLMYYFTILNLALNLPSVKHPRFLLIDTPENSGIDIDHLKRNLELLEYAITLGSDETTIQREYQVILTTGYGKLPESFNQYIVEKFSKSSNNFILKPR
ncbi:AAA family ATPase [Chryseobacterium luquanense]|uniref:AAA family ATPase n=1 Tax=Chryseobacterium luquanense TaxID=2983766 RepID=A0ABT3Y1Z7_9FLAO|nr:AAA family ATPase [Chryseobacterium luquanense]MCX8532166.1 AAA family ATPase [Chryseobacterium luquanense]